MIERSIDLSGGPCSVRAGDRASAFSHSGSLSHHETAESQRRTMPHFYKITKHPQTRQFEQAA